MPPRLCQHAGVILIILTLADLFFEIAGSGMTVAGQAVITYRSINFVSTSTFAGITIAILLTRHIISLFGYRPARGVLLSIGALIILLGAVIPTLLSLGSWHGNSSIQYVIPGAPLLYCLSGLLLIIIDMPDRRRGWITAFSVFLAAVWIALPVIRIAWPNLYFEAPLFNTYASFFLIYLLSIGFIHLVMPVLWIDSPTVKGVAPTLADVAPRKGLTVRQIKEGIDTTPRKRLLFGTVDEDLVRRWGLIGQAILAVSARRTLSVVICVIALLIWPVFLFIASGGHDGAFNRDIAAMWRTKTLDNGSVVATDNAMTAARRAFRDEQQYLGLTREEIRSKLRFDLMNPFYKLNKPKYGWETDQFMARIGDGKNSVVLILSFNAEGRAVVVWGKSEPYP